MFTTSPVSTHRLRRLLSLLLLLALLLSLFAPAAPVVRAQEAPPPPPPPPPPRYQAQVLEGPQGEFFRAVALNNRGQVIGTFAARPNDIPELWEDGRFTRLPMLAGELEPFYPQPSALNDAGHVLVRDSNSFHIWIGGSYVTPTRPEPYYWLSSYLSSAKLNTQGVVYAAVIDYRTYPSRGTAVFWNSGAFGFLPAPSNTGAVITTDLNETNQAVGVYLLNVGSGSATAGFRYVNNQVQVLTAPDSSYTRPEAINSQGQIVGYAYTTQRWNRPVIWQADGTIADLPIGTALSGRAFDINDNGEVIGELMNVGPVIWRDGVLYRLAELLPAELQLNLVRAVSINNAGQILVEGAAAGQQGRFYLLTPEVGVELADLTLQRQERESAEWVDLPPAGREVNLPDGSPARLVASIRNPGSTPVTVAVRFHNATTDRPLAGCPPTATVPPTGTDEPFQLQCELTTSGMAFADGDPSTPGSVHTLEIELTLPDASTRTRSRDLRVRPRPLVFVPGIGGNYARNDDEFWLLNRGVAPGLLEIDPLIRSYDGILATLENTGYQRDRDIFIANYDWRLVPGPSPLPNADGSYSYDGVILGLNPRDISDNEYTYGVDYFGEAARAAEALWRDVYGTPLDYVDVIAHSTGGLVTRTYIQSTAYGGVYDPATGAELPKVRHFISVGVPHRGASKAWNPLHDNWGIDASFSAVLSKIANHAFQKVDAGAIIPGPDLEISRAEFVRPSTGEMDPVPFIKRYVPTINTLLATYAFFDNGSRRLEPVHTGTFANHLLLDLNNGADIDPTRDPNVFLERTRLTAIAGISERTPLYVSQDVGPAASVLSPFTDFVKSDAAAGEIFFWDDFENNAGDGTVPTLSAVGQFVNDPRARVLTYRRGIDTQGKVTHTDLLDNFDIQAAILLTLDAPLKPENLAAFGREDLGNIATVVLDPVQGFVVDGQGRRLGWSEATGPLQEIPNSFWRGQGDGFGLIFGPVSGELRLELHGLDGPYYAQVQRYTAAGEQGGVTLAGPSLARSETVSAPALLPSQPYTPQVSAGGPYTVAEGMSVPLAATGEGGLSFAWDLDGDGVFETVGQGASFRAAGVDGPSTRTVAVRGTLPTGQSATSAATVTVENVAPTATLAAPATATAGQPFTLSLSGASDPGGDMLSFAFDCGQGFGPAGSATSVSCTPTAAGTLTVRASVADDDGGTNTYSATVNVSAAPPTEQPTPALCYAEGAQSWQDFAQGRQKNGKPLQANRSNPALALGLPQRNDTVNFVSLGFGGSLTLRFANPIVNDGTGKADIRVWETSFGDARRSWSRYPEAVKLYASADGVNWTLLGQTTDKDQAYDLVLPQAQYLKLVDVSNWAKFGPIGDGFDLDAVEVLSGCIRP